MKETDIVVGFCAKCDIVRQDIDGVPFNECKCLAEKSGHTKECAYFRAISCWVTIDCEEHEDHPCEICDACDCGAGKHVYFKKEGKIFSVKIENNKCP